MRNLRNFLQTTVPLMDFPTRNLVTCSKKRCRTNLLTSKSFVSNRISHTGGFYRERRLPSMFAKDQYACLFIDSNQKKLTSNDCQHRQSRYMFDEEVVNNNNRRNAVCQCANTQIGGLTTMAIERT